MIRVACAFDGPLSLYWEQGFTAREVEGVRNPKTLSRWRKLKPEGAELIVRARIAAPNAAGLAELEAARETAQQLGSTSILLMTPASLRPTQANIDALVGFLKAHGEGLKISWWAEGLWESQEEARDAVCAGAGVTPALDPLALEPDEMPPEGELFYWRLMGSRGLSSRLSDFELDRLYGMADGREGTIAFTAEGMHRDAKSFQQLLVTV